MNIFTVIATWMKSFWDWAGWKSILIVMGIIWYLFQEGVAYVLAFVNSILAFVDDLTGFTLSAASTAIFGNDFIKVANYIVPVEEFFVALGILVLIFPIAVTIRIIKAWIPTLSG